MIQTEVVVSARDLRKVYRLYQKPSYRFRDMFHLLGNKPGAYTEHLALAGVNLDIRRGEKVAIIGRNGAGKSTFLKLVTRVIEPTSGVLTVSGAVHALLQLGVGFHPDFTGRENVRAYFAQLGITGPDAERRCEEAIEFAELEEYIDQPVKTYSTGMGVRLMFSASTAISPDLLVLDEVLGVGDAYFSQKSFDRMRELCDQQGSTLLLVTHDVYSAVKMCNRVIWFDGGAVMMDGDGPSVVKAYEESIRLQEERRLRKKRQRQLASTPKELVPLIVELQGRGGRQQACPVYVSRLAIVQGDTTVAEVPIGSTAFDDTLPQAAHLVREGSCWGDVVDWHGRTARPMLNYGSSFHKVSAVLRVPDEALSGSAQLVVESWAEAEVDVVVRAHLRDDVQDLGTLPLKTREWAIHAATLSRAAFSPSAQLAIVAPGIQGTGTIVIESFAMLNGAGQETYTIAHGAAARFRIRYRILRAGLKEHAQVFIVISRDTSLRICKFMTADVLFDEAASPSGEIELAVPSMPLGGGTYSVAVEIAAEGYASRGMTKFFSVDSDVYHCLTHALEFTVTDSGWIGAGTIFEGQGIWTARTIA